MNVFQNLPALFLHAVRSHVDLPLLAWRAGEQVVSLPRPEALARVAGLAAGLKAKGITKGDRVGILAPASPEWLLFDLSCLCAGAVTVPLFSNLSPDNLAWEIADSGLKLLLVQDQAQLESIRSFCPSEIVIVTVEEIPSVDSIRKLSQRVADPLDWIAREAASMVPDQAATIIYTSGSTGRPKGVVLSHLAICTQVAAAQLRYPTDPRSDFGLSCLPMAHVFERMVVFFHLANGYPLAISLDVQKVGEDLRIFRPTILTVVPRLLEKMLAKIEAGIHTAGPIKKWVGKAALHESRRDPHVLGKLFARLYDPLAWSKIRLGLGGRLRLVVSGGAPLFAGVERCLTRIGIPIYQGYGMTEMSPVIAANYPGANKMGSVGPPFPCVEVRIGADDEVLVRGPSLLSGFWNNPEGLAGVLTEDGWLQTGDLGRMDPEGFLFLTGRKKDLCKSTGGKYVAPVPIEDAVSQHPWIEHSVVCADDRKFVSILLSLNFAAIRDHLSRSGSIHAVSDFLATPAFHAEIERHIHRVNSSLNDWEKIRRWITAQQPFAVETGELTPTLKVRRSAVLTRYRNQFDGLYGTK